MAEGGWVGVERVMKAKGRWPLRASGMPTTQHSAMVGWDEMACSMEPMGWSSLAFAGVSGVGFGRGGANRC